MGTPGATTASSQVPVVSAYMPSASAGGVSPTTADAVLPSAEERGVHLVRGVPAAEHRPGVHRDRAVPGAAEPVEGRERRQGLEGRRIRARRGHPRARSTGLPPAATGSQA